MYFLTSKYYPISIFLKYSNPTKIFQRFESKPKITLFSPVLRARETQSKI